MAFHLRQGRIRMEVVVGLLLVLGATLDGSEGKGRQCYEGIGSDKGTSGTCPPGQVTCAKSLKGNTVIARGCFLVPFLGPECLQKKFGASGCVKLSDKQKLLDCKFETRTITENTTDSSVLKLNGRSSEKGRVSDEEADTWCLCSTDLCNPAGRSTPSIQVILTILVAASVYTFNIGLGSF